MSVKSDVIIVGGGVVGAACARELTHAGRSVVLIDDGTISGEAWRASAGMLAPQTEAEEGDHLLELGLAGREYYATRTEELSAATSVDIDLFRGGILKAARDAEEAEMLKRRVGWQRQHSHHCDWLDPVEMREQWPWLGPTEGGLWAPGDGSIDPVALVKAFRADAEARGATLIGDRIHRLDLQPDGHVLGVTGSSTYLGDHVIIAAGAWSGRLDGLPRPISVEPVRGQMIAIPWPEEALPGVYFGYGIYVVHRAGEMWVGATMEHAGFDNAITPAGAGFLLSSVSKLFPSVAGTEPIRQWAGLRPGTPDGLPIIGPEPRAPGLWYATGHGRNGVLLAGITGVLIQQLLADEPPFEDISPVRPDRFWSW